MYVLRAFKLAELGRPSKWYDEFPTDSGGEIIGDNYDSLDGFFNNLHVQVQAQVQYKSRRRCVDF